MFRVAVAVAAVAMLCGCANPGAVTDRTAAKASPTAQITSPSTLASANPLVSPTPGPANDPLLVFIRPGAVALVRPDGSVVSTTPTRMDSDEVARYEFDVSVAALIGHVWDSRGDQISPLELSLYDRTGVIKPLAPAASKVLSDSDLFNSPIAVDGQNILVVEWISDESWRYVKLDVTTGAVTVLLTATWAPQPAPPGAMDGPLPSSANLTPIGASVDHSLARLMVRSVKVDGASVVGPAYFEIDLQSLRVTGPYPLPNAGAIAMSADGKYVAWEELRVVSGAGVWDLHIRDLATGRETTFQDVPYVNEAPHGGIRFAPDNSRVALEGYGAKSMGFAVFDLGAHRMIRSIGASQRDEPLGNVPLWWTDSNTIVYQSTDTAGVRSGHRLDVTTGQVVDYSTELGAPVFMLS